MRPIKRRHCYPLGNYASTSAAPRTVCTNARLASIILRVGVVIWLSVCPCLCPCLCVGFPTPQVTLKTCLLPMMAPPSDIKLLRDSGVTVNWPRSCLTSMGSCQILRPRILSPINSRRPARVRSCGGAHGAPLASPSALHFGIWARHCPVLALPRKVRLLARARSLFEGKSHANESRAAVELVVHVPSQGQLFRPLFRFYQFALEANIGY